MLQFTQNAPEHKSGSRLVVAENTTLPLEKCASRVRTANAASLI